MLCHLNIENVGLIEKCQVDFMSGLTMLTGETGAGKSMLMDALSLGLGARADTSLIRHGAEKAMVEVRFELSKTHPAFTYIENMGIDVEEGEFFLRRHVSADKSRAFMNGVQVTQSQLRSLGEKLVDIHGQQDGQLILRPINHLAMLDRFGGLDQETSAVKSAYDSWYLVYNQLLDAKERIKNQADEEILLKAYLEELEKLMPQVGEEESLSEERKLLMSSEKIMHALNEAVHALNGEVNVTSALGHAESALSSVSDVSEDISELYERLTNISHEVGALVSDVENMGNRLEANPERLKEVDDRLFALKDCARKHNITIDELPQKQKSMQSQLESLSNLQEDLSHLEKEVLRKRDLFEKACDKLTKSRVKAADALAIKVEGTLQNLHMQETKFKAELKPLENENWDDKGAERIEFMVATNKGQPLAPLVKVASGGEVSRLMLALKAVFYQDMPETTLVFDEIDTGVSGQVAEAMGQAMKNLSEKHQVFSITHLPQVAAKGHRHVKISKKSVGETTKTDLLELNAQERLNELSRMISGAEITKEAQAAAAKLLA